MAIENEPRDSRAAETDPRVATRTVEAERDNRSITTLFSDLVNQMTNLFRTEVQLLKAELREGGSKLSSGAMEIAAGAVLLLSALIVLLFALVEVMENWMSPALAALIVGVVVAAIGAFLVKRGTDNMSPSSMVPDRTTRQVQKDMTLVKEETR